MLHNVTLESLIGNLESPIILIGNWRLTYTEYCIAVYKLLYAICSTIPGCQITAPRLYSHYCHLLGEIATHSHILLRI